MRYKVQQVDIPVVHGLNEAADERMQQAGAGWKQIDNYVFDKDGRCAKRPRFGYTNSPAKDTSNASITGTSQRLAKYGSKVCYLTRNRIYQRSQTLDKYADGNRVPECGYPDRTVIAKNTVYPALAAGVAIANGWRVYCWIEDDNGSGATGNLWSALYTSDGVLVWRQVLDATATADLPRVFSCGNYAYVVWATGAASPFTLKIQRLDCSSSSVPPTAWDTAVTVSTNLGGGAGPDARIFDACSDGTQLFIVYYTAGGNVTWERWSTVPAMTHSGTAAIVNAAHVAVYSDGTYVVIGVSNTSPATVVYMKAAADLSAVLGATTILARQARCITFQSVSSTNFIYAIGESGRASGAMSGLYSTSTGTINIAGTVTANFGEFYHWIPVSKLIKYNSKFYVALLHPAPVAEQQAAVYLHEIKAESAPPSTEFALRPVCALLSGGLANPSYRGQFAANSLAVTSTAGEYRFAVAEYFQFTSQNRLSGSIGVTDFLISFVDAQNLPCVEFAEQLHTTGGITGAYDGQIWAENGYAYAPTSTWMVVSSAAGANAWNYVATYAWLDASGRLHESAPSLPVSTTGTNPVTITVPCLTSTYKQPVEYNTAPNRPVAVRVYRTLNGGTTYYYVGDAVNTTTGAGVTVTDNSSDSAIDDNPVLYTQGNVLETSQLIAGKAICAWDDRLWVSDGHVARCTKRATTDRHPHFVNSDTHVVATHDAADIVALAVMDDAMAMLKNGSIYVESGSGPGETGVPIYPEPRQVATEAGCSEARSVVLTGAGLTYQSPRGLYLLPRGFGAPVWLGARARDHLASFPTITAAVVVPEKNWALFATSNSAGSASRVLCWDVARNEFTTWSGLSSNAHITSMCAVSGAIFFCEDTPVIWVSDSTQYNSGESFITSTLETTKMRLSGFVTGLARIPIARILGEYRGTCNLTIQAAFNDGSYDSRTKTWTLSGSAGDKSDREWALPVQKVQSLQLKITDAVNGENGYTDGVVVNALSLDVAARAARSPLHSAARG